jgi:hypothetical protein
LSGATSSSWLASLVLQNSNLCSANARRLWLAAN